MTGNVLIVSRFGPRLAPAATAADSCSDRSTVPPVNFDDMCESICGIEFVPFVVPVAESVDGWRLRLLDDWRLTLLPVLALPPPPDDL